VLVSVKNVIDNSERNTNKYHENTTSGFALHLLLNAEPFTDGLSQQNENDQ
jgi:hypothetical protein